MGDKTGDFYSSDTAMLVEELKRALAGSEERFENLARAVTDYIYTVRVEDGRAVETRHGLGCLGVTGFEIEEFAADPDLWIRMVPVEDRPKVLEQAHRVLHGETVSTMEHRIVRKDGAVRWVSSTPAPRCDADGKLVGYDGLIRDVTERKEAEASLRESERMFATLVSNLPGFVYRCANDSDWTMSYVSEGCREVTGYSSTDLIENHRVAFNTLIREDHRALVWDSWQERLAARAAFEGQYPIVTANGEERWVWERGRGVFGGDGALLYLEGFITDVTERRRAATLMQAERDLGLVLGEATTLNDVLHACLSTAIQVSGMDSGGLYTVDDEGGLLLSVQSGLSEEFLTSAKRYAPDSPNAQVVRRGSPIYVTHENMGLDLDETRRAESLSAIAIIPIRERGKTVACLNVASHTRSEIPEWSKAALEDIASRVGTSILRAEAEEAQRRLEREYKILFDEMLDGFAVHEIVCDESGAPVDYRFLAINPAFERMTGLPAERTVGRTVLELMPKTEKSWIETYAKVAYEGRPVHFESFARELKRHFEVTAFQPRYGQFACIFTDITERKMLEERYNQAQKMEAVGRLAGGVAHDLNNLLTPILGYTELLQNAFTAGDSRLESVQEVYMAGTRAKDLVRQLLAFSRKQTLEFKRIDLNAVIEGFEKLLRRTLSEDIRISIAFADHLPFIRGDVGQLEQVLMNLAINAQDAMPEGGELLIETAEATFDEAEEAAHPECSKGRFVVLRVTDGGTGMDEETLARIFEPFFTTKPVGKGTGLGLATVYGIVKQHEGFLSVKSEVGTGTSFELHFPALEDGALPEAAEERVSSIPAGSPTETIMVVEDSDMVRHLAVSVLAKHGYSVLSAGDADECMKALTSLQGPLHLLLTDLVLPGLNGKVLYELVASIFPDVKAIYMSGYPRDVISSRGAVDPSIEFIQKPFSVKALAAKVRSVLDK